MIEIEAGSSRRNFEQTITRFAQEEMERAAEAAVTQAHRKQYGLFGRDRDTDLIDKAIQQRNLVEEIAKLTYTENNNTQKIGGILPDGTTLSLTITRIPGVIWSSRPDSQTSYEGTINKKDIVTKEASDLANRYLPVLQERHRQVRELISQPMRNK
ncbi:MAG TPA: hypothetical protein VE090_02380 [Methylomirabilota bacterium]|nr:hypothetical protein [Methylomirabilota bacterium]